MMPISTSDWVGTCLTASFAKPYSGVCRVLEGYVLYDNAPMLRLLRTSGQPLEVHWDGGDVLSVKLAVPGYATAAEVLPLPTEIEEAM